MLTAAPIAPMSADHLLIFLLQVGVLLGLAVLLGRVAARLGMPAIVGELAVGVILGPSLLEPLAPSFSHWLLPQSAEQVHILDGVAQIGVVLLVAMTGIQLDIGLLRRRFGTGIWISLFGLVIPLALGIGAGLLMPGRFLGSAAHRPVFVLFVGVAMAVSALPVIAKTLSDLRMLHRTVGQLTLIAGTVDDAIGWFLLSIVAAMAGSGPHPSDIALSLFELVAIVLVAATVARPVVRIVFRLADRTDEAGGTVAATVVLTILGGAATQAMGLEAVFGAFVVGIVIGSAAGLRPGRLAPLRQVVMSVLAPLFFATAGLRMDLTALGRPVVLLVAVAVLAIAILGKFTGAYLGARISRLNRWEAVALGAGMNCRGVIELVVATIGLRLGVLTTEMYTIIVLVAVVTSIMAPPILKWSVRRIEHTAEELARRAALDTLLAMPARRDERVATESSSGE